MCFHCEQVRSNSSPAFLPFSTMLHALENQCGEQYRCRKGKHFYAHLVITVIWGIKGFFTNFFFVCEEQESTSFCIKCSKTGVARVVNIGWVGKSTPLNLEI